MNISQELQKELIFFLQKRKEVKDSELELLFPNIDNWYYAQQSANMFYSGAETNL